MDWRCMNELSPAISEESADSEANSGWTFAGTDNVIDDEDDAESCSGVTDHGMGDQDQRILSWKSWLMEISSKYGHQCNNCEDGHEGKAKGEGEGEGEGEDDGMSTMDELVDEKESNRLFWEACLAHGYP